MAKKRNALGKGLGALLENSNPNILPKLQKDDLPDAVNEIPVENIEPNPFQPRIEFDEEKLQELSNSIKEQGIIQPITVRKLEKDKYQLISGERRLKASKLAGLKAIPAYIRTANDEQLLEMALIENIQREDLDPIEIALSYERMVSELKITLEKLAVKVGKKRATVNNYHRLLKLPPQVQSALKQRLISMGHARSLISVERPETQLRILNEIIQKELSVRKVEEIVRNLGQNKDKKVNEKPPKSEFIKSLERDLEKKFGNRTYIHQDKSGRGELKVTFDSTEDLNRLLEILDL